MHAVVGMRRPEAQKRGGNPSCLLTGKCADRKIEREQGEGAEEGKGEPYDRKGGARPGDGGTFLPGNLVEHKDEKGGARRSKRGGAVVCMIQVDGKAVAVALSHVVGNPRVLDMVQAEIRVRRGIQILKRHAEPYAEKETRKDEEQKK